jgi:RNA polymerase sigma-70 factor, ECF subfamily
MNVREAAPAAHRREDSEGRFRLLMARGLDGDSRAYRQLLGELNRYLRGYFSRRIRYSEVEDLVQETLLAVHSKRHTYDRALPFTPWACAVARYKLADHFRRNRTFHVPLDDAGDLFALDSPEESTARIDLDSLLERLPPRQRTLVEDVKLKGLSVEEAARKRGVTAVSARVMLHRSLKWLTQAVGAEDR